MDKIKEVMGLVDDYAKYERQCTRFAIEAKLRELLEREIRCGYAAGWDVCAEWAKRDDLKSDVGSTAYVADRERRIGNDSKGM